VNGYDRTACDDSTGNDGEGGESRRKRARRHKQPLWHRAHRKGNRADSGYRPSGHTDNPRHRKCGSASRPRFLTIYQRNYPAIATGLYNQMEGSGYFTGLNMGDEFEAVPVFGRDIQDKQEGGGGAYSSGIALKKS